jgi:hypothetical protein
VHGKKRGHGEFEAGHGLTDLLERAPYRGVWLNLSKSEQAGISSHGIVRAKARGIRREIQGIRAMFQNGIVSELACRTGFEHENSAPNLKCSKRFHSVVEVDSPFRCMREIGYSEL